MNVENCSDDYIEELADGHYRLGRIYIRYLGADRWFCGKCKYPVNYQKEGHEGCKHIKRVARYRSEHLEALNVVVADPQLEVPIA